jgi:hypothetical protein
MKSGTNKNANPEYKASSVVIQIILPKYKKG